MSRRRLVPVLGVAAFLAAIIVLRPAPESDDAPRRDPELHDPTPAPASLAARPELGSAAAAWAATRPRFEAMLAGDREGYRELLEASRRTSDTPDTPRVAWGRLLAATAPATQERAIGWVAQNGLLGFGVEDALGAGACGVRGPDFVVCVP